jgi:hypothetical protein
LDKQDGRNQTELKRNTAALPKRNGRRGLEESGLSYENMEITFDPKWEAACAGLAFTEEHQLWPDGEWIRHARRVTGINDLFVYHHRSAGTWVLCKWLFPPTNTDSPVALELEVMQMPPDFPSPGRLVGPALLARCRPVDETISGIKKKMRTAAERRRAMSVEREQSKKEAVKYMKNHGMDLAAYKLEKGLTAWAAPSECEGKYQETVSELMALTKAV